MDGGIMEKRLYDKCMAAFAGYPRHEPIEIPFDSQTMVPCFWQRHVRSSDKAEAIAKLKSYGCLYVAFEPSDKECFNAYGSTSADCCIPRAPYASWQDPRIPK
jgi:hypothetical protein